MNDIQSTITKMLETSGTIRANSFILRIPKKFIIESGMNGWKEFCNWLHSEIERFNLLWVGTEDKDGAKIIELHKATPFSKQCTSLIRGKHA